MKSFVLALAVAGSPIASAPPCAFAQSAPRGGDGAVLAPADARNFERFVRDQGECARHEEATPTWSAADVYLGLVCRTTYSGG